MASLAEAIQVAKAKIDSRVNICVYDFEAEPLILNAGRREPMHRGQREAWLSVRRYVAVFAGWRSGKTVIGPWWLLREMQRQGPGDYGVIAPNFPMLDNKARPDLLRVMTETIGPDGFTTSGNIITITAQGSLKIWGDESGKGSRILLRHADNAQAIEAFDAKGLWVDEPGQIEGDETWEAIQARVSIGLYRILLTSRPFKHNWYVKQIWHRVMDKNHQRKPDADDQIDVINFKSTDNPAFSPDEYERQRLLMVGWRFSMKYDGIPTKAAGVIYDRFTTCKRIPIGDNWQRAAGHDFGNKNTAGLWAAKHPERKNFEGKPVWIIYSSYLQGDVPAATHAKRFLYGFDPMSPDEDLTARDPKKWRCGKRRDDKGNWVPVIPWAWGGNQTTEDGWRQAYQGVGYPIVEPPITQVAKGIESVYAMLATGELEICDDLLGLINELSDYTYDTDEEGVPDEDKILNKSKFHRADSLRYLCVGLSTGTIPTIVSAKGQVRNANEPLTNDDSPERDIRRLRDYDGDEPSRLESDEAARGSGYLARIERAKAGSVRASIR